jgi:hypothetical protein
MSVLNVLNTNSISATQSEYQVVNTGIYRVSATSASTVQFNAGPAIQLLAGESVLLKGANPGKAAITAATDSATAVYTFGDGAVGLTSGTHPFSSGDYIAIVDAAAVLPAAFESAATAGKSITSTTSTTITTDIDASAATADYAYTSGSQAYAHRCVKITAGAANIVVEEVQIVGG